MGTKVPVEINNVREIGVVVVSQSEPSRMLPLQFKPYVQKPKIDFVHMMH